VDVPLGQLPGEPINKHFTSRSPRHYTPTQNSNYLCCCSTICNAKICPNFILLRFCTCRSPQFVFSHAHLLQRLYQHVPYWMSRFHGLRHTKVIYTVLSYSKRKTYMSVSDRDNIGRLTWLACAACCTLTNCVKI
jgi:hypothetical protein